MILPSMHFQSGARTAIDGGLPNINPHPQGTGEHMEWNLGYDMAKMTAFIVKEMGK